MHSSNVLFNELMDCVHGCNVWSNFTPDEDLLPSRPQPQVDSDLLDWAVDRLINIPSPSIIEVGSWKGSSALHILNKLKSVNTVMICVDTFTGAIEQWAEKFPDDPASFWSHKELDCKNGMPRVYQHFLRNTYDYRHNIVPVPTSSFQASRLLKRFTCRFDLLYIDAGHSYKDCLEDLRSWKPFLKDGSSVIVGDDFDNAPGVRRAAFQFYGECIEIDPSVQIIIKRGKFAIVFGGL